jgi:crotonobetainyl-CoA:carnitine CoA-transferase CaiB-like acyl-CoA transferase
MVSQPVRLQGCDAPGVRPAPRLGEHTEEILHELGYSPAAIQELEAQQVIGRLSSAGAIHST